MSGKKDRRFLKGLVIGSVIASLVSLLLAPKSGSETRSEVRRRGQSLSGWATERASAARDRGTAQLRDVGQQVGPALVSVRERGASVVDRLRTRPTEVPEEEAAEGQLRAETGASPQSTEERS